MSWSNEQLVAAKAEFPSLTLVEGSLSGVICVRGALKDGSLLINPTEDQLTDPEVQATFLVDSFQVEIGDDGAPYLRLPGERLPAAAKEAGVPLLDLHVYADLKACFSAPQEILQRMSEGMSVREFIWDFVIPFLYGEAYRGKHGVRPWPELAHGNLGLLEWLGRKPSPTNGDLARTVGVLIHSGETAIRMIEERARYHKKCACGSGRRLRMCHPDIKPAIDLIRGSLAQGRYPKLKEAVTALS